MNYNKLVDTILDGVGSKENIDQVTHCATRLRFNLKDIKRVNTELLKETPEILGVVDKGGQFQVIIGSDVANVYNKLVSNLDLTSESPKKSNSNKGIHKIVDTITGIFTPILPAITASGMIKAILSLAIVFNWTNSDSSVYQILSFMADAAFYFLPVLLAASASKKFNTNMYLSIMMGGILLHPNFIAMVTKAKEAQETLSILGLPIATVTYASSVIPIILTIWFMSYVEPTADKISPNSIKFFSKPLITTLVVGLMALVVLGPIGFFLSDLISKGVKGLENIAPWLVPFVIGAFNPLFIASGTHYGLVSIGINNRLSIGYDSGIYPGMLASNIAQGGAALAVAFKSKDKETKQLASSAGLTAVFGITEPALYGINLKHKSALYAAMIGGGVSGITMGLMGTRNFTGGSPGLLTLPSYIGDDTLKYFYSAIIGFIISLILSFIISYILFKDTATDGEVNNHLKEDNIQSKDSLTLTSPLKGSLLSLNKVPDKMFSESILGEGVAIEPSEGIVYAPCDAVVKATFTTKHALGLLSDDNLEILIHVGIDTVKMEGKGFNYLVKKGDSVKRGDALLEFDLDDIKKAGYSTITPVVITNSQDCGDILSSAEKAVSISDEIIKVIL